MPKNKPYKGSMMVEPKPAGVPSDDLAYERQRQLDEQRIAQENMEIIRRDEIGALLGSHYYLTDKSFPFLARPGSSMCYSVTRFYARLNTAVDIFETLEGRQMEVDFKRRACKAAGVRYGALDYSMRISDLIPQTGIPTEI